MAHVARDQKNSEGLVVASRPVSHSKVPFHYFGYHVSHSADLTRNPSYDAFGPSACYTPERCCHPHGDNGSTFTSPECDVSWPAVFLSPAKTQETPEEGPTSLNSDVRVRQLERHDRGETRFASGSPSRPCGLFVSVADYSPCHHQDQQHEMQRQAHKRCRDPQGEASDHSGQVSTTERGARGCFERSANSFNAYRRALLRLVLERSRRTLQQRRKRIRSAWNAKSPKHEGERAETSTQSVPSTGCSRGLLRPESADHVHSLGLDKQNRWISLNGSDSFTNNSSPSVGFIQSENQLALAYANESPGECSTLQSVTTEGIESVDFVPQSTQRQGGRKVSAEGVASSVVSASGVRGVQPRPFQTYTGEALTNRLSLTSPDHFQDINLSLPQQDPVQSVVQVQASQIHEPFCIGKKTRQYLHQQPGDTPVPPTQHEKNWIDGSFWRCSSYLTASVQARAKLTSTALSANAETQGKSKKEDMTVQEVERSCSTRSPRKFICAPEKESWCCTTCNDKKAFCVGVSETNYVCVDSQQLCLSKKCLFPSSSDLLKQSMFPQNSQLLEFRGSTVRLRTDGCSQKGHCPRCFRCYEANKEIWCSHACSGSVFHYNNRAGAATRAPSCELRDFDRRPPGQRIQEFTPLRITSVSRGREKLSERSSSGGACESDLYGIVHDIKAMSWISQEHLLVSVADALTELVDRSGSLNKEERNKKFDGIRCASITVRDYFYRIATLCTCSCSCHLLALIYMDRLQQSVPNLFFDMLNIHRILLTSIMCAAKFYDDTFLSNAYYAMVGGISLSEMNRLEVRFLSMVNFRLSVPPEQFGACLSRLGCISPQNLKSYIQTHERPDQETAMSPRKLG